MQRLLCLWFDDERALRGRPGATVATAAQALLFTHRRLAPDDLTESLVARAHPRADQLLAALAEEEPAVLCRAVDRWSHDPRPERRVAAAVYGPAAAPHVTAPADRELLRYAALALLARPEDGVLHGAALGLLVRDPDTRTRYLPAALRRFAARDPRLPADALTPALASHPGPVVEAFRGRLHGCLPPDRGTIPPPASPSPSAPVPVPVPVFEPDLDPEGEVVLALAAVTGDEPVRRAEGLLLDYLAHRPGPTAHAHAAAYVAHRLDRTPAPREDPVPFVLRALREHPPGLRAALAPVLAAPGPAPTAPEAEPTGTVRGTATGACTGRASSAGARALLLDALLEGETDHEVLAALLGAAARHHAARGPEATAALVRATARGLLRTAAGAEVLDRGVVGAARESPAFAALLVDGLRAEPEAWSALLGPSARRTLESLAAAART
ncbi:hypothetical protein [Streptomyces sp. NPDC097619]|uniref:hypothetical protein n=1 Tax=Streptomyces sp. NPDC097619 TaxID=3157228 RepID=UPI0033212849